MGNQQMNNLGQPIGEALPGWQSRPVICAVALHGHYCSVQPLVPKEHARQLYQAFAKDKAGGNWTYMPYGPFLNEDEFINWLCGLSNTGDPFFYTIFDNNTGVAVGMASFLRIEPNTGVIEVGHIHFSNQLQRTPLATEAMYLMMKYVFEDLGYRRYEWKCDALNTRSKKSALRFGFSYEGVFRQATIYKGRNRDTAWFSIIDNEWANLKRAYEQWLSEENFDEQGVQKRSLKACL
jgi:RimJ/RimL family protein N-acetyltransferase